MPIILLVFLWPAQRQIGYERPLVFYFSFLGLQSLPGTDQLADNVQFVLRRPFFLPNAVLAPKTISPSLPTDRQIVEPFDRSPLTLVLNPIPTPTSSQPTSASEQQETVYESRSFQSLVKRSIPLNDGMPSASEEQETESPSDAGTGSQSTAKKIPGSEFFAYPMRKPILTSEPSLATERYDKNHKPRSWRSRVKNLVKHYFSTAPPIPEKQEMFDEPAEESDERNARQMKKKGRDWKSIFLSWWNRVWHGSKDESWPSGTFEWTVLKGFDAVAQDLAHACWPSQSIGGGYNLDMEHLRAQLKNPILDQLANLEWYKVTVFLDKHFALTSHVQLYLRSSSHSWSRQQRIQFPQSLISFGQREWDGTIKIQMGSKRPEIFEIEPWYYAENDHDSNEPGVIIKTVTQLGKGTIDSPGFFEPETTKENTLSPVRDFTFTIKCDSEII